MTLSVWNIIKRDDYYLQLLFFMRVTPAPHQHISQHSEAVFLLNNEEVLRARQSLLLKVSNVLQSLTECESALNRH